MGNKTQPFKKNQAIYLEKFNVSKKFGNNFANEFNNQQDRLVTVFSYIRHIPKIARCNKGFWKNQRDDVNSLRKTNKFPVIWRSTVLLDIC